jgi:hypothetical protein
MHLRPTAVALVAVATALLASMPAFARGGGGHGGGHSSHSYSGSARHRSTYAAGVPRDANGRIARSEEAKYQFKKMHPCPATGSPTGACPGYVIDHVQPLKRGGADAPYNMQWQTKEEAKIKDRTE